MKGLNLLYELSSTAKEKGLAKTTGTALLAFVAPSALAYLIQNAFIPPWDEPEEWSKELLTSVTDGVPIFNVLIDASLTGAATFSKKLRGVSSTKPFDFNAVDIPGVGGLNNLSNGISKGSMGKVVEGTIELLGVPAGSQGLRVVKAASVQSSDVRDYIWSEYAQNKESPFEVMAKNALSNKPDDIRKVVSYTKELAPEELKSFRLRVQENALDRDERKVRRDFKDGKITKEKLNGIISKLREKRRALKEEI
jgi:hypothetical protein